MRMMSLAWGCRQKPFSIDPEAAKKSCAMVVDELNKFFVWYFDILSGKNLVLSLQIICLLCVTWTIGSWLDGSTLLLLVFCGGMGIPVAYQNNQALVDSKLREAKNHIDGLIEKVNDKIPRAENKDSPKKST